MTMLRDKVVVVAGVGSGVGRSVALASAREGADVVLAARTAARLDDVAKEVTGMGRRGLAVPTDLAEDQAMIVTVPAAGAPYQGIQLGSMWYVSLDYINHQTSLTADQARIDPDRRLRFVISERDPGLANWLELTGRRRGYAQIRWQRLTRDLTGEDGPRVEVVPFTQIAERLPNFDQARVSPPEWRGRIAARQAAVAERMLGC